MSQTSELLQTLKKCLKAKGMSYQQLAEDMGLSETSIKRLFSQESFSLKRIAAVCKILDLDLFYFAFMAKREHDQGEEKLTIHQESELVSDAKLLTFFYFLLLGWDPPMIIEKYDISDDDVMKYLIKLDRLGLIELHPGNRIRLLVTKNVFWRKYGPIWKRYEKKIREDFFNFSFDSPNSCLEFNPGQLSSASIRLMLKKIEALVKQFNDLAEMDKNLPIKSQYGAALHIGFRPWIFSLFADLKRR